MKSLNDTLVLEAFNGVYYMSSTHMIWAVSMDTLLAWMRCEIVTIHYSIPQTCVHNRTLERVSRMSEVDYVERNQVRLSDVFFFDFFI